MKSPAATWLAALVLATVCVLHLGSVVYFAVDVPVEDEWSLLEDLDRPLSQGLLDPFNEHRIAYTRLEERLLYRGVDWDRRWSCATNAALLIASACLSLAFLWACCPALPRPLAPLLLVLWFSQQGWQNYLWGMTSHFFAANLLVLAACAGLFAPRQRTGVLALSGVFAALACLVSSCGVGASAALLLWFACFKLARLRAGEEPRTELLQLAGVSLLFALGFATWKLGLDTSPKGQLEHVLPTQAPYWKFLAWAAAAGAGFARPTWPGAVLAVLLGGLPLLLILTSGSAKARTWACAAPALCAAGAMAAVAFGRGHHPLSAAISRYFHSASLAWPFVVATLFQLAAHEPLPGWLSPRKLRALGWAAACLCLAALDDFGWDQLRLLQRERRQAQQQLRAAYADTDRSVALQRRYPSLRNVTWERIDRARELGLSASRR